MLGVLCAALALTAGCARPKPATPAKPGPLLIDGTPKSGKPSGKPSPPKDGDTKPRPKILVTVNAPNGSDTRRSVTLKWSEKNGTQMTCSAKSADFNEVSQVGTLVDFSAQLYENGKLTASIRAPLATADTAKRIIIASGGVVLTSLERATEVRANWIKWNAGSDKVIGNGGVTMKSTNGSVQGAAFVADTALKKLTVLDSGKGLE